MTQQIINVGNTPNNGEGETLRSGAVKINENFSELYGLIGAGGNETFVNTITAGPGISVNAEYGNITITNASPNVHAFNTLSVSGQSTVSASTNQILNLAAGSNVVITTNTTTNTITIASTQQQSDWNAVSGPTAILHKPIIPAAQIQSDWNQATTSALDYIKNKPTIPTDISQLSDLTNILGGTDYAVFVQNGTVNPSSTTVIYTGSNITSVTSMKLTIHVSGPIGGSTIQSQICELMVTRTVPVSGIPTIVSTVYGTANTASPLATFAASWNSLISKIEVSATNLSSTTGEILTTKVIATEIRA